MRFITKNNKPVWLIKNIVHNQYAWFTTKKECVLILKELKNKRKDFKWMYEGPIKYEVNIH